MSSKNDVIRQQRRWAEGNGIAIDRTGYVRSIDANLRRSACAATLAAFERGNATEIRPGRTRPPKLHALHSSAALVVNVFEYWQSTDVAPLLNALGVDGEKAELAFEEPYATGLEGDPPSVDVAVRMPSGLVVAIESKFTEWLTPRPRNKAAFKTKYFPAGGALWRQHALPACQSLAEDIQERRERFKYLHAAQLLKQALGLATQLADEFAIHYLYYDCAGPESKLHRAEVDRFSQRVGSEIRFKALTYQDLYRQLRAASGVDVGYLRYLRARYFNNVA